MNIRFSAKLIIPVLAVVFVVMSYLSLHFWWQDNSQQINQQLDLANHAAMEYAQENTQQACFEKTIEDSLTCREGACTMELKHFLAVCFEHAKPDVSFCQSTPSAQDYFGNVSWSVSQCRKRKVKNANCPNIINNTAKLCAQYTPEAFDEQS
ncbi:hypothetical protein HR060_11180 [Catenovulum sp. SM1970]|uniref:hypothetical protein n=1 Tax=Marinifaba aquimaris TaxID=2741323 RepID=UPI001573FD26|nr:hypothetical protein [Marinifaba aquimaris]NTS77423.1 hypothetical protein [Marinifaba aquimaris]